MTSAMTWRISVLLGSPSLNPGKHTASFFGQNQLQRDTSFCETDMSDQ